MAAVTDDFVIPEEAVEAGTQAYERGLGPGVHRMEEMVRSILAAALPHLRAHQTCDECGGDLINGNHELDCPRLPLGDS